MKINFAQVPADDVDTYGEESIFGPDEVGDFYYNYVEFGTNPGGVEEVAIVDGCGRFMPITVDSVPDLITALSECYRLAKSLEAYKNLQDFVVQDTQAYVVESDIEYESLPNTTSWPF